jgi:predicted kinase
MNKRLHRPVAQVLVGNIASGKSTYVDKMQKKNPDVKIVSRDAWRHCLERDSYVFDLNLEPKIAKCVEAELLFYSAYGSDIIIDETHMTRRARGWCLDLLPDHYIIEAVVFPDRGEDSHVRARLSSNHGSTSEATWREVYRRNAQRYEEPTEAEGFDCICIL